MKILIGLLLAYAGMTGFCLAMKRHYRQALGNMPGNHLRWVLRLGGWLALALSLAVCIDQWGGSVGPVAWFGLLSAAALMLVFILPYAPRFVLLSGGAGLAAGLIGTAFLLTV